MNQTLVQTPELKVPIKRIASQRDIDGLITGDIVHVSAHESDLMVFNRLDISRFTSKGTLPLLTINQGTNFKLAEEKWLERLDSKVEFYSRISGEIRRYVVNIENLEIRDERLHFRNQDSKISVLSVSEGYRDIDATLFPAQSTAEYVFADKLLRRAGI